MSIYQSGVALLFLPKNNGKKLEDFLVRWPVTHLPKKTRNTRHFHKDFAFDFCALEIGPDACSAVSFSKYSKQSDLLANVLELLGRWSEMDFNQFS